MREQEHYKVMLKKLIDKTETNRIQTSEELIQMLVEELTRGKEFEQGYAE
ncbi:hypothetical protein JNUCC1_02916 [Lentibacillus sp. JNUCC-1]|nr:hypothetical protein [Lentibacillus sp. JNUCC-1]MUV39044.1 hypothetical protein [Lentibacillus sp. JNUCC-1]